MLLFNHMEDGIKNNNDNFNTSNVTIQPGFVSNKYLYNAFQYI